MRAISFSCGLSSTGKRISLPSALRSTLPSTTGLLRASAWAYLQREAGHVTGGAGHLHTAADSLVAVVWCCWPTADREPPLPRAAPVPSPGPVNLVGPSPLHAAHRLPCPPLPSRASSPRSAPGPHGVHLDVRAAGGQELLVDEGAVAAHAAIVLAVVLGGLVVHLAEQVLDATALGRSSGGWGPRAERW